MSTLCGKSLWQWQWQRSCGSGGVSCISLLYLALLWQATSRLREDGICVLDQCLRELRQHYTGITRTCTTSEAREHSWQWELNPPHPSLWHDLETYPVKCETIIHSVSWHRSPSCIIHSFMPALQAQPVEVIMRAIYVSDDDRPCWKAGKKMKNANSWQLSGTTHRRPRTTVFFQNFLLFLLF